MSLILIKYDKLNSFHLKQTKKCTKLKNLKKLQRIILIIIYTLDFKYFRNIIDLGKREVISIRIIVPKYGYANAYLH